MLNHDSDDERPFKRSRAVEDDYPVFVLPSENGAKPRLRTPPPYDSTRWMSYAPEQNQQEVAAQRRKDVADIIKAAALKAEEDREAQKLEEQRALRWSKSEKTATNDKDWLPQLSPRPKKKSSGSSSKPKKPVLSKEEKEANKEKRLLKLIGAVVVKVMSKHRDQMDHEQFKKYAKEVRC